MQKFLLLGAIVFLALFVKNAEPIHCWSCVSTGAPACNDPIDTKANQDFLFKYRNCDEDVPKAGFKSVCMKEKKNENGTIVINRQCSWKAIDDKNTTCVKTDAGTLFCGYCHTDGCNGAATIGGSIVLLLAPLAIFIKFFSAM